MHFFSEMTEIQLIIKFGGHWEGSIYQGGDAEIILVDTNLRYEDLFSRVHGMLRLIGTVLFMKSDLC